MLTTDESQPQPVSASGAHRHVAPTLQATKIPKWVGPCLSVVILVIAFVFLHKELSTLAPNEIVTHVRNIPLLTIVLSILCTVCSYATLTVYDALGIRYLGKKVAYHISALTAFIAYAVGHNVGFAALSGGTIRYRMYSLIGFSATEIGRLIVFVTLTFAVGASLLLGLALLLMPASHMTILLLPRWLSVVSGILLILFPTIYVAVTLFRTNAFVIGNWQITVPKPSIALSQICVAMADLVFAATTLYVILAPHLSIGFLPFVGLYLIAIAAGLISSIPGGIGVFEAVLLAALPDTDRGMLLASIIVYRIIYYVSPIGLAMALFLGNEIKQQKNVFSQSTTTGQALISIVAPYLISVAVFLSGVVLLFSGSIPAIENRLTIIAQIIPLPLLEISHLSGSIIGVCLLVLARGLYRRLQKAYLITFGLLAAGIFVSLLKGLDFEEALILSAILFVLWVSRNEFYRNKSYKFGRVTAGWIATIAIVIIASVWTGVISFRHVEYSDQLWWKFAFNADAPRMLRAGVVAALTAVTFGFFTLLRANNSIKEIPNEEDLSKIYSVLSTTRHPDANASLMGDKKFLWSPENDAFIMYQIYGNSWIALGDPVGNVDRQEELLWKFRELADRYNGRPIFYQVSDDYLPTYIDMGLSLAKLGEEGHIRLDNFSLEGSKRAELRQAVNKARKNGITFDIIEKQNLSPIVTELRSISDQWLEDKGAAEKGFSLGSFSEEYILKFDCAVVRFQSNIVAFANLWPTGTKTELSIDLMRYSKDAPRGIMDFLFTELILWSKNNGYQYFSLGMAPLSGLEQRTLAPLWHKLGHFIFEHGENFYNFEGLRQYKEKYTPEWQPRYIACPDGILSLPRSIIATSRLISGGWIGLVSK